VRWRSELPGSHARSTRAHRGDITIGAADGGPARPRVHRPRAHPAKASRRCVRSERPKQGDPRLMSQTYPQAGAAPDVSRFAERFGVIAANIERAIQGKRDVIHLVLTCLFAEGHLLIEDVPGVG